MQKSEKELNKIVSKEDKNGWNFSMKTEEIILLFTCLIGGSYIGSLFFQKNGSLYGVIIGAIVFYFYYHEGHSNG